MFSIVIFERKNLNHNFVYRIKEINVNNQKLLFSFRCAHDFLLLFLSIVLISVCTKSTKQRAHDGSD